MDPASEPRWRRRKDARPQEIIEAALELFAERGFAATRLDDVAKRAGVSKGTLYLYFPNKEELFKAAVRETLVANIIEAEHVVFGYPGPTIDLVDLLIATIASRVLDSPASAIPKLMIGEAQNFPELTRFYVEEVIQRMFRIVEAILKRGAERGEFRPLPLEAVGPAIMGPLLLASVWKTAFAPVAPMTLDLDRVQAAHRDNLRRLLLVP